MKPSLTKTTVLLVLCMSLAACNTIKGVGQDISAGGKAISTAAKKGL